MIRHIICEAYQKWLAAPNGAAEGTSLCAESRYSEPVELPDRSQEPVIRAAILFTLLVLSSLPNFAQDKKPADTLTFVNGEILTGELVSADAGGIKFNSTMAGSISVPWTKIKSLDSSKSFAAIPKNIKLTRHDAVASIPQGTVAANDKTITVAAPAGPKEVPIATTNLLIPTAEFLKDVNNKPNLLHGWAGSATGGVSLVRATENSTTYTTGINLSRPEPGVSWLPQNSNTTLNFTQSYGTVTQAGTPTIETNIFHGAAERDQYFSPRLFVDGNVAFDHNFSSALALQQAYGVGIGMTVIKNARQELDIRADIHYEKQAFFVPSQNLNLVGSTFSETYILHLPKAIVLNELGSASPAWNNSNAYSAHINGSLVFPVYKGFGFNVSATDDYLNNAPVGTNQNSSQFTTGITYTIKPR